MRRPRTGLTKALLTRAGWLAAWNAPTPFTGFTCRHTTTAVCINEYETRLLDDIRQARAAHASACACVHPLLLFALCTDRCSRTSSLHGVTCWAAAHMTCDPQYLRKLAPATDSYLHNDLHLREAPEASRGGAEAVEVGAVGEWAG
jgi:hypothetical protein